MRGREPIAPSRSRHVSVVGDEQQLGRALLAAVGPLEPEVEGRGTGPEELGQHVLHGLELGVAVGVRLNDLGVDPERDVVDEDPVVHEREIDAALDRVRERVECADDVVPVESEVEREVVARPGGHADVRQPVLHRDLRHERLRAVPAGHPDHVRRACGLVGQRPQVVTGLEQHRLDAASPSPPRRD